MYTVNCNVSIKRRKKANRVFLNMIDLFLFWSGFNYFSTLTIIPPNGLRCIDQTANHQIDAMN
jgi:hypothetical protein